MSAASAIRQTFAPRKRLVFRCTFRTVGKFGRVRERRSASGAVRWFIDARPFGRIYQYRDALGEQAFTSRADAERLLERIRARIEDGMDPEIAVGRLLPAGYSTLGARIDAWLAEQRRRADAHEMTRASVAALSGQVRRYWECWRDLPVGGAKASHVADWQTWMLAEARLSPVTVRGVLGYFHGFMRWLYDREEIERIPRFPQLRVAEHEPRIMAQAAQEAVLAAIPERDRGLYLALVDLALRPNEARALSYADFELADGVPWVVIRRAVKGQHRTDDVRGTKTGRVRRLPATDRLWAWVQAHGERSAGGALFLRGGAPWDAWQVNRHWKLACERAGVPVAPVRESTRHSTATRMRRESGIEDVRELLGHADARTTERYGRYTAARLIPMVRGPLGAGSSQAMSASKHGEKS